MTSSHRGARLASAQGGKIVVFILGVLLAVSGLGFVTRSFLLILAPAYASSALLLPMALAGLALIVWLLAKGVDFRKWEERAAVADL
jgi:hypothetical protein